LETCVEIGLRCTEDDPNERPAIKDIVCQLEELEAKSRNKMSLACSEGQSRDFQVYIYIYIIVLILIASMYHCTITAKWNVHVAVLTKE
jgi:hypothetical protein